MFHSHAQLLAGHGASCTRWEAEQRRGGLEEEPGALELTAVRVFGVVAPLECWIMRLQRPYLILCLLKATASQRAWPTATGISAAPVDWGQVEQPAVGCCMYKQEDHDNDPLLTKCSQLKVQL